MCAAPKGNQFWKIRSKHGRDKLFATPELLWEAATEYFEWVDDNPLKKEESSSEASERGITEKSKVSPNARPYTLKGLCIYLGCNSLYFINFKRQLPEGEEDFNLVIRRIEETIYTQKFEGAAVGAFNANIIARDLGLADKKQVDSKLSLGKVDPKKIKEIYDSLDDNY